MKNTTIWRQPRLRKFKRRSMRSRIGSAECAPISRNSRRPPIPQCLLLSLCRYVNYVQYFKLKLEVNNFAHDIKKKLLKYLPLQEKDQFWQMGSKILNKPKPKVEPPPPEGAAPTSEGAAKTEKKDEGSDKDQASESKPAEKVPEMDVD